MISCDIEPDSKLGCIVPAQSERGGDCPPCGMGYTSDLGAEFLSIYSASNSADMPR